MAKQFRKRGALDRHYLREWLAAKRRPEDGKRFTYQNLADAMEERSGRSISKQSVREIVLVKRAYSQHHLEVMAEVFGCHPCDLLAGPPTAEVSQEHRWISEIEALELSADERGDVLAMARRYHDRHQVAHQNDNFVTPKDINID